MKIPLSLADAGARGLSILSPERAHNLTIDLLEKGFSPKLSPMNTPDLVIKIAGINFPNPVGLAAGFDKNARVPEALLDLGFGFVEVGAVTPKPQPGNTLPRAFRLREDMAVINRYGFNNDGVEKIGERLHERDTSKGIVGINLGANKDAIDRTDDYVTGLTHLAGSVDFYTVNISSPNTPGLRALQDQKALTDLLERVLKARENHAPKTPVFLKIAPDLKDTDKADIAHVTQQLKLDGLIISNTTLARPDSLRSPHAKEPGGLSGVPLFAPSTQLLGEFYQEIGHDIPLIGVGGISSARDAYRKILAGASLIQLYTGLIYQGPGLASAIVKGLQEFIKIDGYNTIRDAIGMQFQ